MSAAMPRTAEVSFEATFSDVTGSEVFRLVQQDREVRMTLGNGEEWPDHVRRGRTVDLEMGTPDGAIYRLTGRVRFRRLQAVVIAGRLARASR